MNFYKAITTKDIFTENAMPTHSTSGSPMLDWFFRMGGLRQHTPENIIRIFLPAFADDRTLAIKSMFALRNVRGGMGERRTFRIVARWMAENYPDIISANLHNIPYFGRWDDVLFVCLETPVEQEALNFIYQALMDGDKLCAKWMPREARGMGDVARFLAQAFRLSPKEYRQILSGNTKVVETLMCDRRWSDIKYEAVPSRAFAKYKEAFKRHDGKRFQKFLDDVNTGTKKIHADAIFPHDIIKDVLQLTHKSIATDAIAAQWRCLPDYEAPGSTLVVADVSGSMYGVPMAVSVSLGLYFAERLPGPFRNTLCTFSEHPTLFKLREDQNIVEKIYAISEMNWDMNTNLEAVFSLVLNQALRYGLSAEDMPRYILIISDMQFDQCIHNADLSAMEMIREMYAEAGYTVPYVIFWNVRTSFGIPVKMNESGVILLSGFSPSLMENVMSGEMDPMKQMLRVLNDPQYDRVDV